MKTASTPRRLPFSLIAIYAMGLVLIALNLKNYLLD